MLGDIFGENKSMAYNGVLTAPRHYGEMVLSWTCCGP